MIKISNGKFNYEIDLNLGFGGKNTVVEIAHVDDEKDGEMMQIEEEEFFELIDKFYKEKQK